MAEGRKTALKAGTAAERLDRLRAAIGSVILGKDDVIDEVLIALLSRGHLLIEDVPGVGKTTLAHALARSIESSFRRIQFTSDLLPSDILGVKVFEPANGCFNFIPGPIFNSIVLADEINRTTPRTQSAFLEAMNENQVTIEGETYALPAPFMVIATQNPVEHHGTYPLPDGQLDRFLMSISIGYPGPEVERKIISEPLLDPMSESFKPVAGGAEVIAWQDEVDNIKMDPDIADYIVRLVEATRGHKGLRMGVSPRGSLALRQAAKSRAFLSGRDYALPDDVKKMAVAVLAHRVIPAGLSPSAERGAAGREIVAEILDDVAAPM